MSDRLANYINAALNSACGDIVSAPKTTRNVTLNVQSFALGQLIGAGYLNASTAEAVLLAAAMSAGLDRTASLATIKSGFTAGKTMPRQLDKELIDGVDIPQVPVSKSVKLDTSDYAKKLYKDSYPIADTVAERYLRNARGIKGDLPSTFRYHPGVYNPKIGAQFPALVAPIIRSDDTSLAIKAVHLTQIDTITCRKIISEDAKKMLGRCKGGAVWLGAYALHMLVAEGIEKALFCQSASNIPAAAGLSSTLLPSVIWPRGTSRVTICADANIAGEIAVTKAAAAWTKQEIEIRICYPPSPGKDWDECAAEDVAKAIAEAKLWIPPAVRKRGIAERENILRGLNPGEMPAFERNTQGHIVPNEFNVLLAITAAGVSIKYNEFTTRYEMSGVENHGPLLDDPTIDEIFLLINREFNLEIKWIDLRRILKSEGRRHKYHPVRNYLDGLEWDGVERIDEWLSAFAGAPTTPFIRAVARIVLIAAVRRIRQPGCKFDEMLILESPEGRNKTQALRILAGEGAYTDEVPFKENARRVIEKLRGRWIVECAELKDLRQVSIEHIKTFLSRQVDSDRLSYDTESTDFYRQCIFIGTTNEAKDYLTSTTGNRRFWPVPIQKFDIDALAICRDQLWAEAAHYETEGESIRLPETLWNAAREQQEEREEWDAWDGLVADYLATEIGALRNPSVPYRTTLAVVANAALEIKPEKLDSRMQKRVSRAMRRAGWKMTHQVNGKRWWEKLPDPFTWEGKIEE